MAPGEQAEVDSVTRRRNRGAAAGPTRVARRPGRPLGGRPVVDRERVLDAAEVAIRRAGTGVSLESIAIEAGVTKPVVYARVGGRTELANALSERLTERLVAAAGAAVKGQPYGRELFARFIAANLATVAEHRELFLYVTGGSSEDAPLRSLYLAQLSVEPMARLLARWRTRQGLDASVAEAWAYAVTGMLNLISLWTISEPDRPIDLLADQLADLLWTGMSGA